MEDQKKDLIISKQNTGVIIKYLQDRNLKKELEIGI